MERNQAGRARRRYDAAGRRAQAARSREAVLDAAEAAFLAGGYAATTIASIAAAAGVSAETIYKAFGGKAGLVRAIRRRALAGAGPLPAEERSERLRREAPDGRALLEGWGRLTAEVSPRVSPVLLLLRDAAAGDSECSELLREADADRLRRMTENAAHLLAAGYLRPGITLEEAAEVLWTYSSAELYELLVVRRGWALERYGRFVAQALCAALLPGSGGEWGAPDS